MFTVDVNLEQCSPGQVVAMDIVDDRGITLVGRDTVLNSYILSRLKELQVERIQIYADNEKVEWNKEKNRADIHGIYQESVLRLREVTHRLIKGTPVCSKDIESISEGIFLTAQEHEAIVKYLQMLRASDEYTFGHCINTAFYCMLISKWIGLDTTAIKLSIQAGMLHDLGKARIPDEVLNKKGRLTAEEFEVIKKHPELGYNLVRQVEALSSEVLDGVLHHHERMDCSGYPEKISADGLGITARIVAVADVYDAMTSDRVYKKGSTPFKAFRMFQTTGVGIFDPMVVSPFIHRLASYYTGCDILLSDQSRGSIVYVPPHDITSPIIQIGQDYVNLAERVDLEVIALL